jgi:GNAT superfamily N-acetyltransferase
MTVYTWRGAFTNREVNLLHAEAFKTRLFSYSEWDWETLVARHSLGWVIARDGDRLIGFVNVVWDGFIHAWMQDVMVASSAGRHGVGTQLVAVARDAARTAGCEFLHVDFEPHLQAFYIEVCGFEPASAGLMRL